MDFLGALPSLVAVFIPAKHNPFKKYLVVKGDLFMIQHPQALFKRKNNQHISLLLLLIYHYFKVYCHMHSKETCLPVQWTFFFVPAESNESLYVTSNKSVYNNKRIGNVWKNKIEI